MTESLESTLVSNTSEVALLAQQAIDPTELEPGTVYAVLNNAGGIDIRDTDSYGDNPRQAKATRRVTDAVSFCLYMEKHATTQSEVWADTPGSTVIGIIDAIQGPEWEHHRVQLALEKSKPWKAWEEKDQAWFAPLDFAEFIDLRAIDVRDPNPADLLDLAQHFTAHRNVDFESSEKLSNGETKLVYKETINAKAGQKGDVTIPDRIKLVLKPYIGGPSYFVWARFRYRLNGAILQLGYVLERPQEILDVAFSDIVTEIRDGKPATNTVEATDTSPAIIGTPGHEGVKQPIYYGKP